MQHYLMVTAFSERGSAHASAESGGGHIDRHSHLKHRKRRFHALNVWHTAKKPTF